MLENSPKTSSSPLAQGNPAAAAYAPRELDDHSFGPEDIASMSAAFEAALGQLGSIERNDLATMAIAKVIIGLAKGRTRRREAVCLSIEADIKVSRPTRNAP